MTPPRTRGVALLAGRAAAAAAPGAAFLGRPGPGGGRAADRRAESRPSWLDRRAGGPTPALAPYYWQKLTWTSCRDNDQCATLRVPLDYAKPGGRAIRLALLRGAGPGPAHAARVDGGQPGRPGRLRRRLRAPVPTRSTAPPCAGSSTSSASTRAVSAAARRSSASRHRAARPRSSPATPTPTRRRAGRLRRSGAPARRRLPEAGRCRHPARLHRRGGQGPRRPACGARRPQADLLRGVVRHLDRGDVRRPVPRHVGRMVLDGALDPASSTLEVNLVQARGFEGALRAYVGACVDRGELLPRRLRRRRHPADRRLPARRRAQAADRQLRRARSPPAPRSTASGTRSTTRAPGRSWTRRSPTRSPATGRCCGPSRTPTCTAARTAATPTTPSRRSTRSPASTATTGSRAARCSAYLPRFEKASPTFGAIFAYSMSACDVLAGAQRPAAAARCTSPPRRRSWWSAPPATRPPRWSGPGRCRAS